MSAFLTSYNETDPVYSAAPASTIASNDITNWNTAFNWGDHSTQGYLTSVGYSDLTGAPSDDITAGLLIDWAGNTLNVVSDLSQYDNSVSAFLTAADLPVGAVYELTVTKTGVNIWNGSGTTTSGVATIYLTDDGLASGNALFSNVYSVQATSANNTTSAIAVPVASIKSVSADKKTLTIEPTPSA